MKPKTNLDPLKQPFDFQTHPQDGIKNVKLVMIRLKPYNDECDITIKIPRNSSKNIHEIIGEQIDYNGSVANYLIVKEAELYIEFHDQNNKAEARLSFIRIQSSGKYELKNSDTQNIAIISKYLKYWGLVINERCN